MQTLPKPDTIGSPIGNRRGNNRSVNDEHVRVIGGASHPVTFSVSHRRLPGPLALVPVGAELGRVDLPAKRFDRCGGQQRCQRLERGEALIAGLSRNEPGVDLLDDHCDAIERKALVVADPGNVEA